MAEAVRCFSQVAPDGLATAAARKPLVDRRKVAGRSRAGRLATATHAELMQHVGGDPSPVQRELIDRAVALRVRLFRQDASFERTGKSDAGYPELAEAYALLLAQLGPDRRAQRATTTPPTIRKTARRDRAGAQEFENA